MLSRFSSESRAFRSAQRLARLRGELEIADQQLMALHGDADDAHVRALVSENVADAIEDVNASRHAAALQRTRKVLAHRIAKADEEHRRLVHRLFPD